jgi:hypothetical protein
VGVAAFPPPNLVIVWEVGNDWKKRYSITSSLDLENLQHRNIHGLTHIVYDDNSGERRFDLIALSELIEYLEDVNAVQQMQTEKYGQP